VLEVEVEVIEIRFRTCITSLSASSRSPPADPDVPKNAGDGDRLTFGPFEPSACPVLALEPSFDREPSSPGVWSPTTFPARAATHAGLASPDYAASSGFLNLLTPCSARAPSALFHAESVPGVSTFRGFPLPVAAATFAAIYPSCHSPCSEKR
jgi:hypothetical protein